jgi:DNA-binding IclR family transcriptional regulator
MHEHARRGPDLGPAPSLDSASVVRESVAKEHRTVSRVMTILETAAAHPEGATLGQFGAVLGAPKSSVHGLARGLVATGYLREEEGRYVLGSAVGALLAVGRPSIDRVARPAMVELKKQFDETVMVGTLVGVSVVYIDAVDSSQPIRYSPPLHQRRPLYPTSTGKCFLAHMSPGRRRDYLDAHVPAEARPRIERELQEVRARGFAINRGETLPDISAAGSPVTVNGRVIACLAVAGPTSRMADRLEEAGSAVLEAAVATAKRLGGL